MLCSGFYAQNIPVWIGWIKWVSCEFSCVLDQLVEAENILETKHSTNQPTNQPPLITAHSRK